MPGMATKERNGLPFPFEPGICGKKGRTLQQEISGSAEVGLGIGDYQVCS